MSDSHDPSSPPPADPGTINRRHFISAIGAAAASAAAFKEIAKAASIPVYYYDSFGNVDLAAPDIIAAGAVPPPLPPNVPAVPGNQTKVKTQDDANPVTSVNTNYSQPNILMIMVDQLRTPRWVPTTGPQNQSAFDGILPNIANLRKASSTFVNYFVAATNCSPSRATLLTGLYSQQTCLFKTQDDPKPPSLQTGFATIGNVLTQTTIPGLNYQAYWIGKWHLSDFIDTTSGVSPADGPNGPTDYGFTSNASVLNLPLSRAQASPNGFVNQGTCGYNQNGIPPQATNLPTTPVLSTLYDNNQPPQLVKEYNDAAIADSFINNFLPNIGGQTPQGGRWFAAVSFVNPHDMSFFPYGYGLSQLSVFTLPTPNPPLNLYGFQPPAAPGNNPTPPNVDTTLPSLPNASIYSTSNLPTPANFLDRPQGYQSGAGKPDAQTQYFTGVQANYGAITGYSMNPVNYVGWVSFLNYYLWMQSCVDYEIGRVIQELQKPAYATYWANTVILFLSDHGEYGGAHWLHGKGGTAYDESINVPLYVSFPGMRANYGSTDNSVTRNFACSSVDILPFIYSLALGNESWRTNPNDLVYYLRGRESILDLLFSISATHRRTISINGGASIPYVLHTSDDLMPSSTVPTHVVAIRTVDTSQTPAGGAKLVQYNCWPTPSSAACPMYPNYPDVSAAAQQYEFYQYPANVAEIGNEYAANTTLAGQYIATISSQQGQTGAAWTELYYVPNVYRTANPPLFPSGVFQTAQGKWCTYNYDIVTKPADYVE